jgi:hypothetical protein
MTTSTPRSEWLRVVPGALLAAAAISLLVVFFPLAAPVAVAGVIVGIVGARFATSRAFHYGVVAVCGVALLASAAMWALLVPTGVENDPAAPPSVVERNAGG